MGGKLGRPCWSKIAPEDMLVPTISSEELAAVPHRTWSKVFSERTDVGSDSEMSTNRSGSAYRTAYLIDAASKTSSYPNADSGGYGSVVTFHSAKDSTSHSDGRDHSSPRRSFSFPVAYRAHTRSQLLRPLPFLLQVDTGSGRTEPWSDLST